MSTILIGALSGWKYANRRQQCQTYWLPNVRHTGMDAVFLMGDPRVADPIRNGDLLSLPCPDDYNSLPQRTLWFCRWAITQPNWDYLFKCDDDTYIDARRLANYDLAGRDYIGAEWRPGVGYGSGGAGYFLSRKAAAIVAERLESYPTGAEDLLVGQVLRAAGVPLSIEPRLVPFSGESQFPQENNEYITGHHLRDELWPEEPKGLPPVTLAACLIARNEAAYIAEWIEFHRLVGVERFFIYDDESSDNTMNVVRTHDRGDIAIVQWGTDRTQYNGPNGFWGQTPQATAYNHCIRHFRNAAKWCAFIDCDEFLYATKGDDLRELLRDYDDPYYIGAVFANWLIFGNSGHTTRPAGGVVANFIRRGHPGQPNCHGKIIGRMSHLKEFGNHGSHNVDFLRDGLCVNEQKKWVTGGSCFEKSVDLLRINHYFHKSDEEAAEKTRKYDRNGNLTRTPQDMARHNLNDVEDLAIQRWVDALHRAMKSTTSPAASQ